MTVFKKIIDRELPADIIFEDELCLAFKDIAPVAPVHILIIPKKEIPSMKEVEKDDQTVLGHMMVKVSEIAKEQGLENGYQLVVNTGQDGGQTVDHLHIHLIGGKK